MHPSMKHIWENLHSRVVSIGAAIPHSCNIVDLDQKQCCRYPHDLPDKPGKTLADPAIFSFVPDRMSDVKLPVKHSSLL